MSNWIFTEIEKLSREAKELSNAVVYQPYDEDDQEMVAQLDLRIELPSFSEEEIQALAKDLNFAIGKVIKRNVTKRTKKIQALLGKV